MKLHSVLPALTAVLAALVLAAACSQGESDEQLLASAKSYLEKKDTAAATIQLKALLQKNPNSAPGRLLLGRSLLENGDPVAALVELNKALELGAAEDEAVPDIARALLLTGEQGKLLQQHAGTTLKEPKASADLSTSLAIAHALQNDQAKAQELSNRALQQQPGYAPAIIVQARLKAADKDIEGALGLLDEVLAREPDNERAGLLKGELLLAGRNDAQGALATFRKVLATHPKAVAAHLGVIGILRAEGKADEVKAQIAELKKAAPNHPDTLFLEAEQMLAAGNPKGALEITERLLKAMPDHPRVLFIAGAAEYRQRAYVRAEGHLQHALKVTPGFLRARQLLAQTYLRSGEPGKAVELLRPVTDSAKADGISLALTAEAYVAQGDMKRADEAYKRAAKAAPDDPRVRTSVALGQMVRGNVGDAVGELESIAASDKGTRADLALISAKVSSKDLAGALKAVDGLQKKMPDQPLPDLLRGRILQAQKDLPGATAAFEAALKKDPKYFPAVAGLASIDLEQGRTEQAGKRFQALLEADPSNYQAHVALAELAGRTGATPQVVAEKLAAAVKANPTQATPRLLLIEQLQRAGDTQAALVAAQDAAAALPANVQVQEALGRAQIAAGDAQQAVSTFTKLAASNPKNAQAQLRLAEAYIAAKDIESAKGALDRALDLQPGMPAARRGLASIAVAQGRIPEALAIAKQLQQEQPKDPGGYLMEGEIQARQRNWPAAVAAQRNAFAQRRDTEGAVRLHRTMLAAGQKAEADALAASWRKEQPADMAFRFYLGDLAIAQKDWAAAESHYAAVVQAQPNNALALNNLAWVLVAQGKPGGVKFAEQANQILPGRAQLLDTLAVALAADNQLPKAIETQKKAVAAGPQDPALRLNLARLYIKAGEKPQARAELEDLARLGDKFAAQAEVQQLLGSVR